MDLRCHGESAALPGRPEAPHSVASAATDILALLRQLKLFPRVLIGHSFGGKVVMSMVAQFPARLPRPVQVWVLDSLPGQVRAGGGPDGADHPGELIALLRGLAMPVASRNAVMDAVLEAGEAEAGGRRVLAGLVGVVGVVGLVGWGWGWGWWGWGWGWWWWWGWWGWWDSDSICGRDEGMRRASDGLEGEACSTTIITTHLMSSLPPSCPSPSKASPPPLRAGW